MPSDRPAISPCSAPSLLYYHSFLLSDSFSSAITSRWYCFLLQWLWGRIQGDNICKGGAQCPQVVYAWHYLPPSFGFTWHFRNQAGPALLPGPWLLQPKLLALCASEPERHKAWNIGSLEYFDASPLVMHWLICHLPVVGHPHQSCFTYPSPAFSLFCHHPFSHSALFWHPLCTEHSIFCIHFVFK